MFASYMYLLCMHARVYENMIVGLLMYV